MKNRYIFSMLWLLGMQCPFHAQTYTSYFTGDSADVQTPAVPGICLMGGATEDDNAMRWFLQQAAGGDILVIRASGSDGYNDYLFSELGISVNSVETIVMPTASSALEPYVAEQIRHAEGVWIAGGDQGKYVNFWKGKPVGDALNELIINGKAVLGGTSAGMAILSGAYFAALNGTVTSDEALQNPFDPKVSIGHGDFLKTAQLERVITDTHYDSPDRRGRHLCFLARLFAETGLPWKGIACEEYTAVCIDTMGIAHVFGDPSSQDYAYFLQTNCPEPNSPEICQIGQALSWNREEAAVKVCKIKGNATGSNTFDLNDWKTNLGGIWQNWWADEGDFQFSSSTAPDCSTSLPPIPEKISVKVAPNPSDGQVWIEIPASFGVMQVEILDSTGEKILIQSLPSGKTNLNLAQIRHSYLFFHFFNEEHSIVKKVFGH